MNRIFDYEKAFFSKSLIHIGIDFKNKVCIELPNHVLTIFDSQFFKWVANAVLFHKITLKGGIKSEFFL